jgi:hypothetical protein
MPRGGFFLWPLRFALSRMSGLVLLGSGLTTFNRRDLDMAKKRIAKPPPVPVLAKGRAKKRKPLKAKPGLGPSPAHGQHK